MTRTYCDGKREADEALSRLVTETAGGGHAAQDATVGDLIDQWFEMAEPDLSPTTIRGYRRAINSYIVPALGKLQLARLGTAQINRFTRSSTRTEGRAASHSLRPPSDRRTPSSAVLSAKGSSGDGWRPTLHSTPLRRESGALSSNRQRQRTSCG